MTKWGVYLLAEPVEGGPHYVVVFSNDERCRNAFYKKVNVLLCRSIRPGAPLKSTEVPLTDVDGFEVTSACQCEYFYEIQKSKFDTAEWKGSVIDSHRVQVYRKLFETLGFRFQ